jgi:hypothetical protein
LNASAAAATFIQLEMPPTRSIDLMIIGGAEPMVWRNGDAAKALAAVNGVAALAARAAGEIVGH